MKESKGMNLWFKIVIVAVLIFSSAFPAGAENDKRKLHGEYSTNFILSCGTCSAAFTTISPFNPSVPGCLPDATSITYTSSVQGVYKFDGKGNVAFYGRYLGVLRDPINKVIPVVLPSKLKCDTGTYTVNDDLTFEAIFEPCFVYGDDQETIKVHEILNFNLRGQLLDRMDGPILLLTDTFDPAFTVPMPNIETVITYPPSTPPLPDIL